MAIDMNGKQFRKELKEKKVKSYDILEAKFNDVDVTSFLSDFAKKGKLPVFRHEIKKLIKKNKLSKKQQELYDKGLHWKLALFFEQDVKNKQLVMRAKVKTGETKSEEYTVTVKDTKMSDKFLKNIGGDNKDNDNDNDSDE